MWGARGNRLPGIVGREGKGLCRSEGVGKRCNAPLRRRAGGIRSIRLCGGPLLQKGRCGDALWRGPAHRPSRLNSQSPTGPGPATSYMCLTAWPSAVQNCQRDKFSDLFPYQLGGSQPRALHILKARLPRRCPALCHAWGPIAIRVLLPSRVREAALRGRMGDALAESTVLGDPAFLPAIWNNGTFPEKSRALEDIPIEFWRGVPRVHGIRVPASRSVPASASGSVSVSGSPCAHCRWLKSCACGPQGGPVARDMESKSLPRDLAAAPSMSLPLPASRISLCLRRLPCTHGRWVESRA
jgi:hypothetical protein